MLKISYALIALSCLAFVLAVISGVFGIHIIFDATPETFSRSCNNLALIAIALALYSNKNPT